ncbi:hypothetical protein G6730_09645 [Polynucleobacter paneuropaeus]|nr:hypothetical protein [Polynucleobacter paneuropaeus]
MVAISDDLKKIIGVVTFLDVLGWKGIYDRHDDAILALSRLVQGLIKEAKKKRGIITRETEVKSISDTIVIFSYCFEGEIEQALEIHGQLCQWAIPQSIKSEIPVRGATAYGEFSIQDNIFVGKAIDEAAAWHEQADWIGVHLTPSAEFVFRGSSITSAWHPYIPPLKSKSNYQLHAVNWKNSWIGDGVESIETLKNKFRKFGPIVPEIAGKFFNTLDFYKKST